jgi:hypothetical protein
MHAQRSSMANYGTDYFQPYRGQEFACRVMNQLPRDVVWDHVRHEFGKIYGGRLGSELDSNDGGREIQRWVLSGGWEEKNVVARRLALKNGMRKPS